MKVAIGCDHGGFELKEKLAAHLRSRGFEVDDKGCNDKSSVDYPVYARAVAKAVAEGQCDKGIVICTTGIGVSIVANKVKGVRCALCSDSLSARMTRLHNNANVLAMGAGIVGENMAMEIADVFLDTRFSNEERHVRRVNMIEDDL